MWHVLAAISPILAIGCHTRGHFPPPVAAQSHACRPEPAVQVGAATRWAGTRRVVCCGGMGVSMCVQVGQGVD